SISGPKWLKHSGVANSFIAVLRRGEEELHYFKLNAFCIMPNHVHLVIVPKVALRRITNGIKGASARRANAILYRIGRPFWQDESYDHWIRDEGEFGRICEYVECNPVSAGLVTKPEHWPWSSAYRGTAIPASCGTAIPGCAPTTKTLR